MGRRRRQDQLLYLRNDYDYIYPTHVHDYDYYNKHFHDKSYNDFHNHVNCGLLHIDHDNDPHRAKDSLHAADRGQRDHDKQELGAY